MTLALTKEDKTPRKTPHEAAAETLLARLQRALDHAASAPDSRFAREHLAQGYDPRADPATLGAMASDLAARIDAVSAFYKVDRRIKTAVNERLAAHWWLTDRSPMSDTLPRGEDPAADEISKDVGSAQRHDRPAIDVTARHRIPFTRIRTVRILKHWRRQPRR